MPVYSHSSRELIERDLSTGIIKDSTILNSDIDNLNSNNISWNKTSINDSNCNNTVFSESSIKDCNFYRSSFINSAFLKCNITDSSFSGLSLIKLKLYNSRINNHNIESCTMQRANIKNCIFQNTTLQDFEGIFCSIENSVFINCNFEINYGCGMNGFSSATIKDCIFINCNFTGYPLRGTNTDHCTFIGCIGEISDDINSKNSFGLDIMYEINASPLTSKDEAYELIKEVKNV